MENINKMQNKKIWVVKIKINKKIIIKANCNKKNKKMINKNNKLITSKLNNPKIIQKNEKFN
jgi:hypothetical protein